VTTTRLALGAAVLAGAGLLAAGCGSGQPAPTVTVTRTVAPHGVPSSSSSSSSSAPAPAPVSTTAQLEGSCALGWENYRPSTTLYGPFTEFPHTRDGQAPAPAYQVTLTNTSSATARLGSWVITYENKQGQETGSANGGPDTEPTYILPGQTLTFTESTADNSGMAPLPAGAHSCQFLQWR
jgi:hypothetical protein